MATDLTPDASGPNDGEQPERLDLRSMDVIAARRADIVRLFPEARTEGGQIDFDRLRLALGETVDVGRERYGMNWPGKADCFRTIQTPSVGTLLPSREESVNFDTTENLIIEGDNLEVLKLLQKSYLGKVKMIYIDPPYNTGNDFIYPDNYTESLQTYLEYTGQVDDEGRKFGTNTEADGRFHSRWMNMMYPRLYLARNLLRDDGVIFVSIDDGELSHLRALCDDIFGEENFIANVIWQKVFSPKNSARHLSEDHDYVLLYARSAEIWRPSLLPRTDEANARYENPDDDPRGAWTSGDMAARNYYSEGQYEVTAPGGNKYRPPTGTYWRVKYEKFLELDRDNRIWWGTDRNNVPRLKRFLLEVKAGLVPQTLWTYQEVGHTQEAKKELLEFVRFDETDNVLDTVKPSRLVRRMLQIATSPHGHDLILDFFSGSGSTAHAVLAQNAEDRGNRQVVLIQLPEPLPIHESALRTISDITKERVRRVIKNLADKEVGKLDLAGGRKQDRGFRVFKLAESNLKTWNADAPKDPEDLAEQIELHIDHIRPDRTQEDILFEILMKSGYPLTARVEPLELAGKKVFSIADGALLVCLEKTLTMEVIQAIAARGPERVVCLDEGFAGNDQLKANAVQTFKTLHRRGDASETSSDVTVFRTV
jgi:adenine-specific DNA-methyltransferase